MAHIRTSSSCLAGVYGQIKPSADEDPAIRLPWRSRLPLSITEWGTLSSSPDCSRLSQFPARTPCCFTPATRSIAAAVSGALADR